MSLHKLTAGSGYDYLTRHVAAFDATDRGHTSLASYYTERGETPGVWVGTGLTSLSGLNVGDPVTQEQMQALFGAGYHPLARKIGMNLSGPDLADTDVSRAMRLGQPFKVYAGDVTAFRMNVAERAAQVNTAAGLPADWPLTADERARIRTQVAREMFTDQHQRPPADDHELAGFIATQSRPRTQAVAGFDLTFSPVKSVSALWALADPATSAVVERAHRAAIADALAFLEKHALFTRVGTTGVRQVPVTGLVAAAFTHRDSRAGDPDLHTHVAVANKVQTLDGRWLAIDGRLLFKANVTASETYNTALDHHLTRALGIAFADRPGTDARKRPVREIIGIPTDLLARWSIRRAAIEARRAELATKFQAAHGRPPTAVEAIHLAQQANLETREAKHEPRTLAEQRASWAEQAQQVLGGHDAVQTMLRTTLTRTSRTPSTVDEAWIDTTAARVLEEVQTRRATWQSWHVRAEAQRQIRAANIAVDDLEQLVDRVVEQVLAGLSTRLGPADDGLIEPAPLLRPGRESMYAVHGADTFTSADILAAEARLLTAAGRRDGAHLTASEVETALLEGLANGSALNAGQADLVRAMATSGARLQLAIAPAGAGKTTAMATLTRAWTTAGGTVLGLAPSAAAAAQLADATGTTCDTLDKLTWHLRRGDLPDWARTIGRGTLVIIDEAGMADTLTLDTAVAHLLDRGASVRLIGDDQQLAAVGAGGVLRDIATTHGALHLSELLRFDDPAEAAASLALRDRDPAALGYYLDNHRVHIGDPTTSLDQLFTAWAADVAAGRDALMLAPTRDLVAQLNHRARTQRLQSTHEQGGYGVPLADGNFASRGDVVLTRTNDRRLRISPTDWVKNGDRWTVTTAHPTGALTVTHTGSRRSVTLPAAYVATAVELGYATTIHTAQGVTAGTLHGLITGTETRQQLYTMLTRGRAANHVYVQVVGDGDAHTLPRPETVTTLPTAVDVLEGVLARDGAATSATTTSRVASDPGTLLGLATAKYADALLAAAEHLTGPDRLGALDRAADHIHPGLPDAPAWATLRGHLLLLHAHGEHPITALREAAGVGPLDDAADPAAVLDWRIADTLGACQAGATGPLPWLSPIPPALQRDPQWAGYLTLRHQLVAELAAAVRERTLADTHLPAWAAAGPRPEADVVADIQVWRAASRVDAADLRPLGPPAIERPATLYQRHLTRRLSWHANPAWTQFADLITSTSPDAATDPHAPVLAQRLAAISRAGLSAPALLTAAAHEGTLPVEHPAAALWWRIARHLTPALATDTTPPASAEWQSRMASILGEETANVVRTSPAWPTLAATIDHALHAGWPINGLLTLPETDLDQEDDPCEVLIWRAAAALDPLPRDEGLPGIDGVDALRVHDLDAEFTTDTHPGVVVATTIPADGWVCLGADIEPPSDDEAPDAIPDAIEAVESEDVELTPEAQLALAALRRDARPTPQLSDAAIERLVARAHEWDETPLTRERMLVINELTLAYYQGTFPGSWAQSYLTGRMRTDLTGHPDVRPGYAPDGWTTLAGHLHRLGVTDEELLDTGVATRTRSGRIIDRFRNRLVLPITHRGDVLGFVARRHPNTDDTAGPKYLNTPDTPLFHKGTLLYGWPTDPIAAHTAPVLVEGALDAIAVTLAGNGRYVGMAPLGTALTEEQVHILGSLGRDVIIGTDNDPAGNAAAERAFWALTPYNVDPGRLVLPNGSDPAQLVVDYGPATLSAALLKTRPLGELLTQRLTIPARIEGLEAAVAALTARPSGRWDEGINQIAATLNSPLDVVRRQLAAALASAPGVPGWRATVTPRGTQTSQIRVPDPTVRSESARRGAPAPASSSFPQSPQTRAVPR